MPLNRVADWDWADFLFRGDWDDMSSSIKARRHGFADCVDTQDEMLTALARYREERVFHDHWRSGRDRRSPGARDMTAPYDLSGMRILLTGAAGGIGSATARLCASLGAEMVLTDAVPDGGMLAELARDGRRHVFETCDVRSRPAVEAFCARHLPLDALILNAGVFPEEDWLGADWDEQFRACMDVNVPGPAHFVRATLAHMKRRGNGRIVLLGSLAAHTGETHAHSPTHYAASKGAVHAFVRWLARRAAPEVLVNAVAPGSTRTRMTAMASSDALKDMPVPRFGELEEIAWPLAFLCSPGTSFMCGAIIDVNGGAHMR